MNNGPTRLPKCADRKTDSLTSLCARSCSRISRLRCGYCDLRFVTHCRKPMFTVTANEYKLSRITRATTVVSILATIAFGSVTCAGATGADARGAASVTPGKSSKGASEDQQKQIAAIKSIVNDAMKEHNLKALIVQVTAGGRQLYTEALGESMSGVPATPAMHFRNGAMAFTYISTILMELVDQKKVSLDDKLSKFLPDLPHADRITLKNLANMTSGYADYVYEPEVLHGIYLNPFRQ